MTQNLIAYLIVILSFVFLIQKFFFKKSNPQKVMAVSKCSKGCTSCPIGK